jgi:hypothetical protein
MPDTLQKLRPDRDLQCYFLQPTAVAALNATSPTGFTVSGSWREQFDWAVIEWNRDNTFEHPLFRNLPDGDLSGVTLTYQETRQNCIPIDSNLFATVDWPSLRIWAESGGSETLYYVPLAAHATPITGSYVSATAIFTLQGTVTTNDYIELAWSGEHYTYQILGTDTIETAAAAVANAIHTFSTTMEAAVSGAQITLTYTGAVGANGNRIGVYGNVSGAQTESWEPGFQQLSGGASPTGWQITLNFSSLEDVNRVTIPTNAVRKMRWTYSADLQAGSYERTEFEVSVSNWTVSGSNLGYQVAGPGSMRVEDTSSEAVYTGSWTNSVGNFSGGTITSTTTPGDKVSCTYRASQTHELYLGTCLIFDGTEVTVAIDSNPPVSLDLLLAGEDVLVRILLGSFSGLDAHTITITHAGAAGTYFYFDFLEMAVPTPNLPVLAAVTTMTLATDWDTEQSSALAPERTAWMIQALGFAGRTNHYAGALLFYELVPQGYSYASATVEFAGTPSESAVTTISIGVSGSTPTAIQHLNLIGDTAISIAKAFELLINSGYTAIWAQASGNVLTIWARAIGTAGNANTLSTSEDPASGDFTITVSGATLAGGVDGSWLTDLTVVPRMNRAARDWSTSFFEALAGYGIAATASFSMELGNGDPSTAAGIAQRYPSGNAVTVSTPALQTNFSPTSTAFWQQVYLDMATLLSGAGQIPYLQFGEVQWWYSPDDGSGMPYYDAYTTSTFEDDLRARDDGIHDEQRGPRGLSIGSGVSAGPDWRVHERDHELRAGDVYKREV